MTRHFITIEALGDSDLASIYDYAVAPIDDELMKGQGVALVFERPSVRTRASSSTAVHELGGFVTFFNDEEMGLDTRESAEDIARTLSQMYAISALRVRHHGIFARMRGASADQMSLINLLSDVAHPTQAVADVLALAEHFANGEVSGLRGLEVAYVGDVTNVTRSLAVALLRLGVNVTLGAPEGYQLLAGGEEDPEAVQGPGVLRLSSVALDAVKNADAVYTDAWVSMGFEDQVAQRRRDLGAFRVDEALLAGASQGAVVMHCLPAHRGDEITDEVLDGPRSLVWRQAYHRRTAMRGVLRWIKETS
ncbi:MAG TPA: ornithine carbamoyltransferase [Acidimicrobiales bacterium]|nr:ornithine carbamoyltransferase [Acidimicrobiales bacterium]